ncbi:sugar transferase [Rhodococcus aetherivorans]|uniref:Sugar transferase n=1 Tax=Rhodococcus aetherivorans TaxID=191292 RepID=A0AA46SAV9_9NOCA|nr:MULTISPECIES: sugar transferase [Rhodococcus]UYF95630.1 sugar transferase [Rhodococcus aetherivorans]
MNAIGANVEETTDNYLALAGNSKRQSVTGRRARQAWQQKYARTLWVTDGLVVVISMGLAHLVRFGGSDPAAYTPSAIHLTYNSVTCALAILWISTLAIHDTRSTRVIGTGPEEYRRIGSATFRFFGLIAIISLLFRLDIARGYLAIALPVGLAGLLVNRWAWRRLVVKLRRKGELRTSVLVVGGPQSVHHLARSFERQPSAGFEVIGVCIPGHTGNKGDHVVVDQRAIPILGDDRSVLEALEFSNADTVAVSATEHLGHEGIKELAWALEPRNVDLIVAPNVVDVAGPRVVMRPIAGLPLLHVEKPNYQGATRFAKVAFDRTGAVFLLLVLMPVLLLVSAIIKITDQGPVFYKQTRIGLDGREFRMWKFRSMIPNADRLIDDMRRHGDHSETSFFKSARDPRITPIGRLIRRTSVDELPQLFNVLLGDMSLVGPRPLVPGEGMGIKHFVERRMLVRPGMTGLWQVSGRSDLPEEERVRLDLFYVENWSMIQDLMIIGRTVRAVLTSRGAY